MNVKRISGDASSFNNSANLTANAISLEEQPADVGNSALSLVHSKAWWMEEPRPLLNCHEQAAEAWPDLAEPKTAEEGAQLIKIAIRTEKLGIIQAGRVYHAIRSKLLHGEYGRMWKLEAALRPARTPRTVKKYADIGKAFGSANRKCTSDLPASVDALCFLAPLGLELVMELIEKREIDESTTAKKAKALRDQYRPELKRATPPFTTARWLSKFNNVMDEIEEEGAQRHLAAVLPHARQRVERMRALAHPPGPNAA